jgi:hypothetical protein
MDQRFTALYDQYVQGSLDRRAFVERLSVLAGSAAAAAVALPMISADKAEAIAASVFADPTARALVVGEGYVLEQRIDWTCAGRAFRSTPDAITRDGLIVDLKTSIDASIRGFQRRAWNFSYHAQLACYREAVRSTGRAVTGAVLIAVETSEPYAVTVHRLSDRVLSEGDRLWRSWFDRLLVCEASDHWPGYADDAVSFDLPEWVEIEDEGNGDENR